MNREKLESYLEKNPFAKLSDVVTQILYDEIVVLDIPPSSKLNINQIATDLGISRTPVVEAINAAGPDFVMVCLGSPKQELWMAEHAGKISCGLMAGLGGSLDVLAGNVQRAPETWRRLGLEWLYRVIKEPKRIKRVAKLPLFVLEAARKGRG